MANTWTPPEKYENRPVVVLGGGVLGRRIATCWGSAGYDVVIRDPDQKQCDNALEYISQNVKSYSKNATTGRPVGKANAYTSLEDALKDAWIVFEAVPEKLEIKIDTFAELERLAPEDCILASNSSSYKSSEMLEKVQDATKTRILNTHYCMPPALPTVELMTDGHTAPEIFPWLVERHKEAGLSPYVARKESTGFIFNRIWAAIKREILTVLAEGVSTPEEIDSVWTEMFINSGTTPCALMDNVGLDTVVHIEEHYIHERGLSSEKTVDFLKENYISAGKLGDKSSKGGLYPPKDERNGKSTEGKILVLDSGLGQPLNGQGPAAVMSTGRILEISLDGKKSRALVENLHTPDGIDVCKKTQRMFWSNMGVPTKNDGTLMSANMDGSDVRTIVPPGSIHTPKQLIFEPSTNKLYVSDREGMRVWRCNTDGSDLEVIIQAADWEHPATEDELLNWCVGIAAAPKYGKFYWTQKGHSKANEGRIFSANIDMPAGQTAANRTDIKCVLSGLPECIDLDCDEETDILYWTDRGEVPVGNSLYRVKLDDTGNVASKQEILARNLDEAIGVKVDTKTDSIYATDLGGSLWKCKLDGSQKKRIYEEETACFTGLTLLV